MPLFVYDLGEFGSAACRCKDQSGLAVDDTKVAETWSEKSGLMFGQTIVPDHDLSYLEREER